MGLERNRVFSRRESMDIKKDPRILQVSDLVNLGQKQRLNLLGARNWLSRREFMKGLVGITAIASLPVIPWTTGCGGGSSSSTPLTVEGTYPANGGTTEHADQLILIKFNGLVDKTAVISSLFATVIPSHNIKWMWDVYYPSAESKDMLILWDEADGTYLLQEGKTYDITIGASNYESLAGEGLDGDGDGSTGDNFNFSFTAGAIADVTTCYTDGWADPSYLDPTKPCVADCPSDCGADIPCEVVCEVVCEVICQLICPVDCPVDAICQIICPVDMPCQICQICQI
jgi:hypothetical protein